MKSAKVAEIVLILLGLALIIDSWYIHALVLDYAAYGIGFLDAYFDHWMLGALFVGIGVAGIVHNR